MFADCHSKQRPHEIVASPDGAGAASVRWYRPRRVSLVPEVGQHISRAERQMESAVVRSDVVERVVQRPSEEFCLTSGCGAAVTDGLRTELEKSAVAAQASRRNKRRIF